MMEDKLGGGLDGCCTIAGLTDVEFRLLLGEFEHPDRPSEEQRLTTKKALAPLEDLIWSPETLYALQSGHQPNLLSAPKPPAGPGTRVSGHSPLCCMHP